MFAAVSSSKSVSTLLRRLFTIGGKIVVTKHKDYPRYFFFHAVIRIPLHTNNNPHQSFFLPYLFVTNSPVFPKCVSLCYLFVTATNHLLLLFSSSSPWKKKNTSRFAEIMPHSSGDSDSIMGECGTGCAM